MERVKGIEPSSQAWEAHVLPLNHTRYRRLCCSSIRPQAQLSGERAPHFGDTTLVWCLAIGWCFVAPKTAWGKARRGSIAAALCDRGATKPQAVFGATLRAADLFASRFVARSSPPADLYALRAALGSSENSIRLSPS